MAKQHGNAAAKAASTHRWAVDQLEEGTAAVEQDGDHVYQIPRWLLPPGARDGDVFTASPEMNGEGVLVITVRTATTAADAATTPRPKRPRSRGDSGGDIVL
jgi:hypothetical protein